MYITKKVLNMLHLLCERINIHKAIREKRMSKSRKSNQKWIIFLAVLAGLMVLSATAYVLLDNGVILLNNPSSDRYPIRGVDVSNYQGEIDWAVLSSQNIDFAFIKSTEGSSFVDASFSNNWEAAQQTDLRVGAYHFFSYDSPGITQAENFIRTVPSFDGMLPPVVDVEFYGDKESNPPDKESVTKELQVMLSELESHYGMQPIIYTTKIVFDLYIDEEFSDYPLWIREVYFSPNECSDYNWTFWQYTNREKLEGYNGVEEFIDMNVFFGTREEFYDNIWKTG
jgi:lysozyme